MKRTWRFINNGYADAYTNLAVDEAIFIQHGLKNTLPTLRVYGWNPAAFSLGYFQDAEQELDIKRCAQEVMPFVRRITGGGIIFHHQELTYSLACFNQEINASPSVRDSFRLICSFLLNAYRKLNLQAIFAAEELNPAGLDLPSAFCFASRARYDILVNGKKIGGNAQKRRKNLIFQHGSIPLRFDMERATAFLKDSPQDLENKICSLEEALGRPIGFNTLKAILKKSFEENFYVKLEESGLTKEEAELAYRLREQKYTQREWNLKEYAYNPKETCVAG